MLMAGRGWEGNIAWLLSNFDGTYFCIFVDLSRLNGAVVCRRGNGAGIPLLYSLTNVLGLMDWSVIILSLCANFEQKKMLLDVYPQRRANVCTQVCSQILRLHKSTPFSSHHRLRSFLPSAHHHPYPSCPPSSSCPSSAPQRPSHPSPPSSRPTRHRTHWRWP